MRQQTHVPARHPLPTRSPRGRRVALAITALGLAWALAAQATDGPLPEVFIVVDTSASMQFRPGADLAPVCGVAGKTDERSRWIAAREMLGGTFINYSCTQQTLPTLPEAQTPPSPSSGPQKCIPGLPMAIGTPTTQSMPSGANGGTAGVGATLSLPGSAAAKGGELRVPWLQFDWSKYQATGNYVAGNLTAQISAVSATGGAAVPLVVTLVSGAVSPTSAADTFCCAAASSARVVVSDVVNVSPAVGAQASFGFTQTGLSAISAMLKAGQNPTFAITYANATWPDNCNPNAALGGVVTGPTITWAGYGSGAAPALALTDGTLCPSEGPTVHSKASGLDDNGQASTKPNGKDGILDVFGPVAKFALLVTDGVLNKGTSAPAGFSFGQDFNTYWGSANHGMQDPFLAGTFSVPMTRPDTLAARAATYAAMQDALANLIPNGPTPLGQQLQDVVSYFSPGAYQDPHFKSVTDDAVNGDIYATCRRRMVVVLTDGGANLHDGTATGRELAVQAAAKLWALNVPVYVLAVGHPASGALGPPAADLAFLDDLAAAGGTGKSTAANTPLEAVKAISAAIADATVNVQAYTHPVVTLSTGNVADVQHSFQGASAFDIAQPLRSTGRLEQRIFACDGTCKNAATPDRAQVCSILEFSDRLKARTKVRSLYTQKVGARIGFSSAFLAADDLGIGTVGIQPKLTLNTYGDCVTSGSFDVSNANQRNAYRNHLINTVAGAAGTCREQVPFGAPSKSTPGVIEPASRIALRDASFQTYTKTTVPTTSNYSALVPPGSAGRPTMLLAATHDGLLHAFRTDRDATITVKDGLVAGDEMWAWLPRFNLAKLASLKLITTPEASYLGGAVATGHVQLTRTSTMSDAAAAMQWRAVAVVGAGEAGSGYTAIDLTAPDDPQLLWEISPDKHCFGPSATVGGIPGPQCLSVTTYQNMGRSVAKPYIANLYYALPGETAAQHAVVILPLGLPSGMATASNYGVEGLGKRGVLVVDLSTGQLVREFGGSDIDTAGMPQSVTSSDDVGYFAADPACYNATPGQLATRCFVGDTKGILWRLDVSDASPAKWTLKFFHDAYGGPGVPASNELAVSSTNRAPILSAPSLSLTSGSRVAVVYGTGALGDTSNDTRRHLVYSLTEDVQVLGDGSTKMVATRNWVKVLAAYERFVGPPLVFALNAYWASFAIKKDGGCENGVARLWGARYDKPQAPSDPTDLAGAFPDPANPASKSANLDSVDVGTDRPSPVDVQAVPACRGNCNPTDVKCVGALTGAAAAQALGAAKPRYEVGAATGNAQNQAAGQAPKAGAQPTVGTVAREVPQPRTAAVVTGWDLLVD